MKKCLFVPVVFVLALLLILGAAGEAGAQISYTTQGSAYTQNFDGLLLTVPANNTVVGATNLPAGWAFVEAGGNANTLLRVDNGSSGTGDTFLFGATGSNERAFGSYASGSLTSQYGVQFVNNSGATITSFTVTYDGEQWRDGGSSSAVTNKLTFSYALGATSLTAGTYVADPALDFTALVNNTTADVATDGNAANFRTAVITKTITGISWTNNGTLWLRWTDINDTGNDDGLAIDNFSFTTPSGCTPPATPTATNDGPVSVGATLHLSTPTVSGASYSWVGPNNFTSTNQNPALTNVTLAANGAYFVTITVGNCSSFAGQTAVTVNGAPVITSLTPANLWAYTNQTAIFTATASGNPAPTLQWQFNGVDLPGQTATNLAVALTATNQSGIYSLVASNALGAVTNSATLTVTPKPQLVITEVMSSQLVNNLNGSTTNHGDWFELSNLGTFAVNLRGLRMDDNSYTLTNAVTVTNNFTIAPGESVVFIELSGTNTSASQIADFRTWWGLQNSNTLQIVTYGGAGVGLSASGDAVILWNAAATNDNDYLDRAVFAGATPGVSFGYDPGTGTFGGLSQLGTNGAYAAPIGGDVGSPGRITGTTPPPTPPDFTGINYSGAGSLITWLTQPNYRYSVLYKTNLTDAAWITLTNLTASGNTLNFLDTNTASSTRFYRIILTP